MTTVAVLVKDTLGMLGVFDPRQPVRGEDMETAIRFLNRLCERIEADGISLGWTPVENPSDTVPLPSEVELGVMYLLAVILAPHWQVSVPQEVLLGGRRFEEAMLRDQAVATPIRQLVDVPVPSNWGGNASPFTGPLVG